MNLSLQNRVSSHLKATIVAATPNPAYQWERLLFEGRLNKRFDALSARKIRVIVDNSNDFQPHEGSVSHGTPTKVKIHNRTGARVLLDA